MMPEGRARQGRVAPWLYVLPALLIMAVFIIYPGLNTFYLSFRNVDNTDWATASCVAGQPCWGVLENYRYSLSSPIMQTAFINNLTWIALMVSGTVLLGLLVAMLADRVRYESLAKAIIFLPMAISFVGAGVIWKFMYDYGSGQVQIGLLNAIVTALGGQPVSWLTTPQINNLALIVVGVWMWTGFCMTILSAAIKSVPTEILEAAHVDGASELRAFRSITIPLIWPTMTVVITPTSLRAIAKKAAKQPGYRFQNLYRMLDEDMLRDSWQYVRKDAAVGVDRVRRRNMSRSSTRISTVWWRT